jgi:hypothetical protein
MKATKDIANWFALAGLAVYAIGIGLLIAGTFLS